MTTDGLYISDDLLAKYLRTDEELGISKSINKKIFTVKNTPLSYRQINTLDNDSLLSAGRRKEKGWRKFSYKDMIYLLTVLELKKYGLTHDKLRPLWDSFYETSEKDPSYISGRTAEVIIGCILAGVEIVLTIDHEGNVIFYDPDNYATFPIRQDSYIYINVNSIANRVREMMHKDPFPINYSLRQQFLRGVISSKEEELIQIIRNDDYINIKIKKKNGEVSTVQAKRITKGDKQINPKEILKSLEERDYQNISITKRDGNIVHYDIEDTYKL